MDPRMQEYARLVIEVGLNIQKGQPLVIRTPVQAVEFARACAEAAYNVDCREVITDFSDAQLTRMKYLRADGDIFDTCPQWLADKNNALPGEGAAVLSISADDPDAMKGVDPDRILRSSQASGKAMEPFYDAMMANRLRWCVASVPIVPWAAKVFPDKTEPEAMDALWEAIYTTLRITGDGQAVARWQAHTATTQKRCDALNAMRLETLHYTNSLGTDLTLGLPEGAIWSGGAERDAQGIPFVANMPTEEVFTAPHKDKVNGRVVSSMPFVLHGTVIDRFAFVFENGKITGIEAEDDAQKALLQTAITVDEGAAYLGEVALVPFDSPISNLRILFYNTLFDENASCHLAFGKAYPTIEGGEDMDKEALAAAGLNDSFTHKDFMVGTSDLTITGTTRDGKTVAIFTEGNFAF